MVKILFTFIYRLLEKQMTFEKNFRLIYGGGKNYKSTYTIFLFMLLALIGNAQVKKENDSTEVYEKIENFSKQSKFTKAIHKLIFRPTTPEKQTRRRKIRIQNYAPYHRKPIRQITIETLDPFGQSVYDKDKEPRNWISRVGNDVHIKSKEFAIRNLLLFTEGDLLDTLKITESKRLMRSQNFIRSVQINVRRPTVVHDSVNVTVRILDSWSLIPKGSISTSRMKAVLEERNFLGFGHTFNNRFDRHFDEGISAYSFEYEIPTIKNTYINTRVNYQESLGRELRKSISIDRGFISPLTKWAGGVYLDEQFKLDSLPDIQNNFTNQSFKFNTIDLWLGRAFKIFDGKTQMERTTNLITSIRFAHANYKNAPTEDFDQINYFSKEHFYLGRLGIASRQFVEDEYIFRDGIVEDVPIGFEASITSGLQRKNKMNRPYIGADIAVGDYFNWGYYNLSAEYGTFLNDGKTEQSALAFEMNYFTELINLGSKWKLRQFVKPQFLLGFNRLNTIADRINLNENYISYGYDRNEFQASSRGGIQGFDSDIVGTKKAVLSLQTQFYSPWNIIGFRLNPFINITSGIIGNEEKKLWDSKIYSSLGLGFIIRNDYLVFSTFQLSFSFFPEIPGQGRNIIKSNVFESSDFGFQSIEVGKPTTVWYE